ncbi:peptidoglycan DD-metalloendopeptidase family protein [Subdoligranulum variabile]|uniref:Peptidase, M23 family n=1 Tax=Subdoligranulum variabile DSM 15176 TaxID=411471 RepID=D1PJT6_9FIRM|nr:peptidoglycan DD-metalloendopeptidase family protein [Subdoligranulum variabile]EFB77034.1 peptidase, M23 family [Subdoligranulum variabile DSM 15176]UWP67696.1 peptidoglycan DD-metalloendopeptidase family protein [Subdoligranulum variabile]
MPLFRLLQNPLGDFLYAVGFFVEYTLVRLFRRLRMVFCWLRRALGNLLLLALRPPIQALLDLGVALHSPGRFLLGYLLPAAATIGLILLVRAGLSLPFALRVTVNGQTVGYVASEEAFDNARADVLARVNSARELLAADRQTLSWDLEPSYTLSISDVTMTESEVANEILRISGSEISEATAVYVDGVLCFVTTEGDHLRRYLNSIKAPWEDPTSQTTRVSFVHGLRLVDGIYLTDSVVPYADVLAALQANDGEDLQVKVSERITETQEIPYDTETQEDSELDFGKSETVQEGVPGSEAVTRELTYINGTLVDDQVVDVQVQQSPTPEIIRRGTRLKNGMIGKLGTGTFIWPVPGYRTISRWANLQVRGGHRGVDIAAPYGTPIYASDSGTVVEVVNMHPSWGNYVTIDHGNGYKTLYAHMSSFAVSLGDTVSQGQVIGYVGSTGDSTGNHCHFEMSYNNVLFSAYDVFPNMPIKNPDF